MDEDIQLVETLNFEVLTIFMMIGFENDRNFKFLFCNCNCNLIVIERRKYQKLNNFRFYFKNNFLSLDRADKLVNFSAEVN